MRVVVVVADRVDGALLPRVEGRLSAVDGDDLALADAVPDPVLLDGQADGERDGVAQGGINVDEGAVDVEGCTAEAIPQIEAQNFERMVPLSSF